jgi:general secretion pathway protein A
VDEAQNFAIDVLEQIRLLTNLETSRQKLLQITLIGQPELRALLARSDLRQLAQRITGRYHLQPLSQADTEEYVQHRMKVAGSSGNVFSANTCRELFRYSGGVPRIINVIADRALLGAYTQDQHSVDPEMVRSAAAEVYGEDPDLRRNRHNVKYVAGLAAAAVILIGAATYTAMRFVGGKTVPTTTETIAPPAAPEPETPITEPEVYEPAISITEDEAPIAAVLPVSEDLVNLEELIIANTELTNTRYAFAELFRQWSITFDMENSQACKQAQEHNLFCLFLRGSLSQIQKLDRPVILTLQDENGIKHQATLVKLNAQTAGISLGGRVYEVSVNDINSMWFGEFALLWRPQIGTAKLLYPGMKDSGVIWLRESLAKIQGMETDSLGADYFDDNLKERLQQYQVTRRINVDGLAGQQTQIIINTDLGVNAPRLVRAN